MFEDVTPREFLRRQADGELWQLVDVRESWEIEIVSLDGAVHIPMAEIPQRLPELDGCRPLAVLCHSGGRSARVADFLDRQGFARVANIAGGIDAWSRDIDDTMPRY